MLNDDHAGWRLTYVAGYTVGDQPVRWHRDEMGDEQFPLARCDGGCRAVRGVRVMRLEWTRGQPGLARTGCPLGPYLLWVGDARGYDALLAASDREGFRVLPFRHLVEASQGEHGIGGSPLSRGSGLLAACPDAADRVGEVVVAGQAGQVEADSMVRVRLSGVVLGGGTGLDGDLRSEDQRRDVLVFGLVVAAVLVPGDDE